MVLKMRIFLFFTIALILFSCEKDGISKGLETDIYIMNSLAYQSQKNFQLNEELRTNIEKNDSLFQNMVSATLSKLYDLQEYAIEHSGGYKSPNGNRSNLINNFYADPSNILRDNDFGVTKDYLNQIPEYLNGKGLKVGLIAMGSHDDIIYARSGERNRDWFELAFNKKNIYQVISTIEVVMIEILYLERKYLQSQLNCY